MSAAAITVTGTSSSATTVTSGGSSNTVVASGSNETYLATSGTGRVTIDNATSPGSAAQGQLDISSGISSQNLRFIQGGNDLDVDIMGTHDQFAISIWFGSNPAASLAEITAGDGLKLDSSVLQLVQAMADLFCQQSRIRSHDCNPSARRLESAGGHCASLALSSRR